MNTSFECLGRDLREGDTIEVWWQNHRDTITKLTPYAPPTACGLPPGKWQIASFALNRTGMTISPDTTYIVLNRAS